MEYRAQRYLNVCFNKWREFKLKFSASCKSASSNTLLSSVQGGEFGTLPDDRDLARTLLIATHAYMQDCETMGTEAAWLALPRFEQERLREASRYFPVDIPEEWNGADTDDPDL